MAYGVHGKWFMPTGGGKMMPWLGVGVGAYNRKAEESASGISVSTDDTKVGFSPGVGLDYMMSSNVAIGVNGMHPFTSGKFKDSAVNWNFISFNGVVTFHVAGSGGGGGGMK